MEAKPPTPPETEAKRSINWGAIIGWPIVILILYVVSIGPVMMLQDSGRMRLSYSFLKTFYAPLVWAYDKTPLHKPLGMYLHLWSPKAFNKAGDEGP
ncbi:MAG TPA: hypothetical protein VFC07_08645 [Verrucomicrobiae bacterium]|nr:hypothetical protein [Verrucomicrobiae bacterium]